MSHYKPYPAYKDSGVEWLGLVPQHWVFRKVKYIARFSGGGTPSRDNLKYWNGDIPWVSPKDMKLELIYGAEESITISGLQNSTASLVEPGHVLLVVRSGILKHTIPVAINKVEVALNQDMKALYLNPKEFSSQFFLYWVQGFNDDLLKAWLKQGATVESIEQEFIAETLIPMPSLIEQSVIAIHLVTETTRIDGLVAKKTRFIDLLREKRQALITHAVTKGLNPDVKMKDSGVEWLGEVPEHWTVKKLGYFADVLRGKFTHRPRNDPAFYDGNFPFIQTGDITGTSRYITSYKQTLNKRGIEVSKEFPRGTLVMAIAANIGDVAILDFPAYFPDSIVGLIPTEENNLMFLFFLMQSMKQPMLETATISTQMNLNIEKIVALVAAQPPLQDQVDIVSYLNIEIDNIDTMISKTDRSIDLLKERRSALITAAVTGQIDLREAA